MRGNQRTVGKRNNLKDQWGEHRPLHRHVRPVRQKKHLIILIHRTGPSDEWVVSGRAMLTMAMGACRMDVHGTACSDFPTRVASIGPEGSHKPDADQQTDQPQAEPSRLSSHGPIVKSGGHLLGFGHYAGSEPIYSVH